MKTENTKYKDSGIPWIGLIPEDWKVCRLKNLHTDSNVGESIDKTFCSDNPNDILFYTAGLKPIHTTYLDFPKWKYTHKSNLLLSRNGTPYVYIPKENAVYSDHIIRIDIDNRFSKEFVRYCLQQAIASVVVDSVSIATWSISLWDKQNIPIPPLPTQQRIADYLDKKCAEIDELAALQETMIAELKRYKQSVITEAVTGKLRVESGKWKVESGKMKDESGKLKDSGVEWIGEIPEGWESIRLRFLCTIQTGNQDTQDAVANGVYPFYVRSPLVEHSNRYSFEGEGILMAGDGAGAGRVFHHVYGKYAVHQRVYRLANFQNINSDFLYYFLSSLFCMEMDRGSAQSTVPSVRLPMLQNFRICIPPLAEQQAIADYLDEKCSEIDELIAIKQQKIEQLKEYKKSVIFEYVTGKKEVKE